MPLRDYSTRQAYVDDYRSYLPEEIVSLAPTRMRLNGNTITDIDGGWTRPKTGGFFRLSLGRQYRSTLNRTEVNVTAVNGNIYTTDNPAPWPDITFDPSEFVEGAVTYGRKRVVMHYDGPFMRDLDRGVFLTIRDLLGDLSVPHSSRILFVGVGYGYEVEAARRLGYNAIGQENSTYIGSTESDLVAERAELAANLQESGIDPASDEASSLLDTWMADSIRMQSDVVVYGELSERRVANAVSRYLGGAPDWVISSYVLSILNDAEAIALSQAMRSVGGTVAHYTPIIHSMGARRDGDNWKTIDEWKQMLAPDIIAGADRSVR